MSKILVGTYLIYIQEFLSLVKGKTSENFAFCQKCTGKKNKRERMADLSALPSMKASSNNQVPEDLLS